VCVPKEIDRQNPTPTSGGERREAETSTKRVVVPVAVPTEPLGLRMSKDVPR
ncbi:hypothetical protein Dimus_024903, partial [Dionaea muscipula]